MKHRTAIDGSTVEFLVGVFVKVREQTTHGWSYSRACPLADGGRDLLDQLGRCAAVLDWRPDERISLWKLSFRLGHDAKGVSSANVRAGAIANWRNSSESAVILPLTQLRSFRHGRKLHRKPEGDRKG